MIRLGLIFMYGCVILLLLCISSFMLVGLYLCVIHIFTTTYLGIVISTLVLSIAILYLIYTLGRFVYEEILDKKLENANKIKYKNKKKFSEDLIKLLRKNGYIISSSNFKDYEILYMSKSNFIHKEDIGLVCYVHRIIFKNGEISDEIYEICNHDLMLGQFDKYKLEVNLCKNYSVKDYMKNILEKNKEKCFKEYREAFVNG